MIDDLKSILIGFVLIACVIGFFILLYSPYNIVIPIVACIFCAIMATKELGEIFRRGK